MYIFWFERSYSLVRHRTLVMLLTIIEDGSPESKQTIWNLHNPSWLEWICYLLNFWREEMLIDNLFLVRPKHFVFSDASQFFGISHAIRRRNCGFQPIFGLNKSSARPSNFTYLPLQRGLRYFMKLRVLIVSHSSLPIDSLSLRYIFLLTSANIVI